MVKRQLISEQRDIFIFFTINKDEERKKRYVTRHKKNENWNDPKTAGFDAKNILWNKPSVKSSVEDTNNRFKNIHIKLRN
jgi:hypothetical protein